MPRRNYRRRRPATHPTPEIAEREPTFEELARRLVRRGVATVNILDRPDRMTYPKETR